MTPVNMYLMDGLDLWTTFGITVEKGGLDDLLKIPKRKDTISHNWLDENGIDVDLSRVFLEAREIQLPCLLICSTEAEFWLHYNQFLSLLVKPGLRRFSVNVFGRDYYVFYKDCQIYQKLTHFQNTNKLICRFRLIIVEATAGFENIPTFLVDEDNRFIIT